MNVVCAACGSDLTVAREVWDNASVLRPLESIEVAPCCTCLSRAASEADDYRGGDPTGGAAEAMENDEHQRESAENGGLGR